MRTSRKPEDVQAQSSSQAYQNLFSIQYYEQVIENAVEMVLAHGRPLVGLDPLPPNEPLTPQRLDAEYATAEPFVKERLARTGMGFLTLVLSEAEWCALAESAQAPYRAPTTDTAYDRVKAAANAKVRFSTGRASSAPREKRSVKGGLMTRG